MDRRTAGRGHLAHGDRLPHVPPFEHSDERLPDELRWAVDPETGGARSRLEPGHLRTLCTPGQFATVAVSTAARATVP